jgi:membrane-bound serine protease (ClpP class)
VVLTVAALFGAGLAFVATKVVAARHQPVIATGLPALLGRQAVVRTPLRPRGQVYVEGALWQAEADGGTAEVGDTVVVRGVEGLVLHVEPAPAPSNSAEGAVS